MRQCILIVLGAMLLQCTYAQVNKCPKWTKGYFEETNNSYVEVVSAEDDELENARYKAIQQVMSRRSLATGARANISINGNNIQITSKDNLVVKARVIDEYVEHRRNGKYYVYLLVQTAKHPSLSYDPIFVSNKYPFSARVFIPGMAQIHKGSVGKGTCFIVGECVLVGGIVAAECLRLNYAQQIAMTHNNTLKQHYVQNANICNITRNVCIAGAAAIYVWNMIDGIVAKGKNHITIGNLAQVHFAPYADYESGGIAAIVKF